jgi:hypothetical protein
MEQISKKARLYMPRHYTYELDNSAIIHLATLCKSDSNVFRIEVRLSEDPDPALLQALSGMA